MNIFRLLSIILMIVFFIRYNKVSEYMELQKIKNFAKQQQDIADDWIIGKEWKGYRVFEPVFFEPIFIGHPYFLVSDGKEIWYIGFGGDDEAWEYIKFKENNTI